MERNSLLTNGAIYLYGDVGGSLAAGEGFTDQDVLAALAEHGPGAVTARINSAGGLAHMGMAIYSLFKSHPGKVSMVVDGVAASAASLIAMAGAVREMRVGSMMMIHDPAALTIGPAAEHEQTAAALNKLADNYAEVYAAAAGKTVEQVRAVMKATTWLNADDAVAQGYATVKTGDGAVAFAAFDYSKYKNAPAALMAIGKRPKYSPDAAAARMRMRQLSL